VVGLIAPPTPADENFPQCGVRPVSRIGLDIAAHIHRRLVRRISIDRTRHRSLSRWFVASVVSVHRQTEIGAGPPYTSAEVRRIAWSCGSRIRRLQDHRGRAGSDRLEINSHCRAITWTRRETTIQEVFRRTSKREIRFAVHSRENVHVSISFYNRKGNSTSREPDHHHSGRPGSLDRPEYHYCYRPSSLTPT